MKRFIFNREFIMQSSHGFGIIDCSSHAYSPLFMLFGTISIIAPLSEMFIIYSYQVFIISIDCNSCFWFYFFLDAKNMCAIYEYSVS